MSYFTFGNPAGERTYKIQRAVATLDEKQRDFEYEGEMAVDVALDPHHHSRYSFARLIAAANALIMSTADSASSAARLLKSAGGGYGDGGTAYRAWEVRSDRTSWLDRVRHCQSGRVGQ